MTSAEIIAVGTELLTSSRLDTNSLLITERLGLLGIDVVRKQVIGDEKDVLSQAVAESLIRTPLLITIGGLGPTEDDVTREAVAVALGRPLRLSEEQKSTVEARFRAIHRPMAENNLRQAYVIEGADVLPNPNGTAPGQFVVNGHSAVAMLPGPPRELRAMLEEQLVPRLQALVPTRVIRTRTFRIAGMGESDLDRQIAPIYTKYSNPVTTVLSAPGDLFVILRATGDTEEAVAQLLRKVGDPIRELLGVRVYSENGNETLEMTVGRLLREQRATLAIAESFTGGMLAARLTEVPGCSDYFRAGFVPYSEEEKEQQLGVDRQLIRKQTAVSEAVVRAMAEGARQRSGATYAVATTGWAGPDGGTPENPVGTVYIAVAGPDGTTVSRQQHGADRVRVRALGTQNALNLLRLRLLGVK